MLDCTFDLDLDRIGEFFDIFWLEKFSHVLESSRKLKYLLAFAIPMRSL